MTIVNDPQDGYKGLFIDKESLYTENFDFSNFRNVASLISDMPLKTPHSIIHPGIFEDNFNNS